MKKDLFVVLSTAGVSESERIARLLVEEKLAACVNVAEVGSYYRWKGEFCEDREALLIIKTERSKVDRIIERIKEVHSYELPEIIALPVVAGDDKYLAWVEESIE
ncbi:MAG: divalent-cation tolerance protein CutA [Candidatus Methanospirareceae archaeon]